MTLIFTFFTPCFGPIQLLSLVLALCWTLFTSKLLLSLSAILLGHTGFIKAFLYLLLLEMALMSTVKIKYPKCAWPSKERYRASSYVKANHVIRVIILLTVSIKNSTFWPLGIHHFNLQERLWHIKGILSN